MPLRVSVFIDAHNAYRRARAAFFNEDLDFHTDGQIQPMLLGRLLCERRPHGFPKDVRELTEVRIYSGEPSANKEPKNSAAHRRQVASWRESGAVVITRPLRYPRDWPASKPQEKGVDVALAIDFVIHAIEKRFDVGIIVSSDTDLKPAVEYVLRLPDRHTEVAAWVGSPPITIPESHLWCHRLGRADFDSVADTADYNIKRSERREPARGEDAGLHR